MRQLTTWKHASTVTLLGALVAVGRSSPAQAQPTGDPAAAEQLFERGKALLKEGNWPAACAKFQASMDLDAAVGTLLKLAKCHEHEGKLARAWADYEAALAINRQRPGQTEARRAELADFATNAMIALRPRIPLMRIVVRETPPGLRVTRGGQVLSAAALEEDLPVDPGPVEIVAEAPGYVTVRRTEVAVEGQASVVAIVLTPVTFQLVRPEVPVGGAPPPPASAPDWRPTGIWVSAGGIVLLGVAAGFGIDALTKVQQSSRYCDPTNHCTQPGYGLRMSAGESQTRGLISLGVGVPLLIGGLSIFFAAPHGVPSPHAELTVSPSSVAVRGAW